jgi:murein DD-endopeptidase MepM/ murein hydrolase activator NlpD
MGNLSGRAIAHFAIAVALATAMATAPALADEGSEAPPTDTGATTTTTIGTPTTTTTTPSDTDAETEVVPVPAAPPAPSGPKPLFRPVKRYDVLKKLVFPVVGVAKFHSGFGACRDNCTREHHGIDITTYGWKGLPVVAAHDGVVTKVTYDEGNPGCSVRIRGKDRWETRYYHLNNDIPGTDEIGAPCPAAGIEVGSEVSAGQIIGYIGDSGNSEHTVPHLHFELRNRSGYPIDPYRSLKEAERVTHEWLSEDLQSATIAISTKTHESASNVTVIPSEEIPLVGMSESDATLLDSPVIAVDRAHPGPALAEIARLGADRIIVLYDGNHQWLEELVRPFASIVFRGPLPKPLASTIQLPADAQPPPEVEMNMPDRFSTLIAGRVDRIPRKHRDAYEAFIERHRAIVFTAERWAPHRIGVRSWSSPGKHADRDLLWWRTGDGWVGTASIDEIPSQGVAYVRDRDADTHTLTYLGQLAEMEPYPLWRA